MDAGLTLWITAAVFLHALGDDRDSMDHQAVLGNVPGGIT